MLRKLPIISRNVGLLSSASTDKIAYVYKMKVVSKTYASACGACALIVPRCGCYAGRPESLGGLARGRPRSDGSGFCRTELVVAGPLRDLGNLSALPGVAMWPLSGSGK